ncbi:MAG: 16S rRNA (cytidine(1402)-2'-O)-methyltransferase [Puniceicoccales bacterium]|jgi:16S rRNA (cytidine1402-2'-O)-methyltransferase|nr:16S rRNA (cytidine(1402)-2'-O)-methyltransferase [Puniceicoccales bacterium]
MNLGKLFVVATPIGNLQDMTFRAIETLRQCPLIACEDRRVSLNLLRHFSIDATLIPYHNHNERMQTEYLLQKIDEGNSVALICDAGTPTISDPGFHLVRSCKQRGITVIPIPGACASTVALSASGLPANRFLFVGFPGHKMSERRKLLEKYASFEGTLLCYESCHRVEKFLTDIAHVYGPDRTVSLCKELTKIHETILTAPISDLLLRLQTLSLRGEFVVLIAEQDYRL